MALVKGTGAARRVARVWANPPSSIHSRYAPPSVYSPSPATWRTPHTSQYGAMPAAAPAPRATTETAQADPWAEYAAMSSGGYAMPSVGGLDMSREAWELVNAAIRQQKAANANARKAAEDAYQQMLREYTQQYEGGVGSINEAASVDRARLNNMLSARGISVGEKAAMNFGNLDAGTQRTLAEAEAQYRNASQKAAEQLASRVAELTEKDRLLDENAPAQALAIQQQLEAAALDSQLKQQQIAAAQAAMQQQLSGGGGTGGGAGGDVWQNVLDTTIGGINALVDQDGNPRPPTFADGQRIVQVVFATTGIDLRAEAARGNKQAEALLQMLGLKRSDSLTADDVAAARAARNTVPATQEGRFSRSFWPWFRSSFTTPYTQTFLSDNPLWNSNRINPLVLGYRGLDWLFNPKRPDF